MKRVIFFTLLFLSSNIYAGEILNNLKKTPATQYQVGVLKLEMAAFILSQELKDDKIKGTSFKITRVSTEETEESVYLKFFAVGKTKDVTDNECTAIKDAYTKSFNISNSAEEFWPGLNDKEYKSLSNELLMRFVLISKDNNNFNVTC